MRFDQQYSEAWSTKTEPIKLVWHDAVVVIVAPKPETFERVAKRTVGGW